MSKYKIIPLSDFTPADYDAVARHLENEIHDMVVDEEYMEEEGLGDVPDFLAKLRGAANWFASQGSIGEFSFNRPDDDEEE